jgi:hypothetical protein
MAELTVDGNWFALTLIQQEQVRVLAGSFTPAAVVLDLKLGGATRASARLNGEILVLGDSAGRILVYELSRVRRVVDLRTA